MFGFDRRAIYTKCLGEGRRTFKAMRGEGHIEWPLKTKPQITGELNFPFRETITIETTEPFAYSADIESFTEESALVMEPHHKVRRKPLLIADNELLQKSVLSLWFEREASYIARCNAESEGGSKEARQKLNPVMT